MSEWQKVLAFPSDNPEFVLGFEAGRIWNDLRETSDDDPVTVTGHVENAEIFLRMGEATERSVSAKDLDDNWIFVTFASRGL